MIDKNIFKESLMHLEKSELVELIAEVFFIKEVDSYISIEETVSGFFDIKHLVLRKYRYALDTWQDELTKKINKLDKCSRGKK